MNRPTIEKSTLRLGFIPLTDCAVLVMAKELGFFARNGLDVTLVREASWANIRDKVALGALDGAHMLATMPLAATSGVSAVNRPMVTAFGMGLGGNGITLSNALHERMRALAPREEADSPLGSARALKRVIEADRRQGNPPLTFAHVFPASTHNYELRYWLAAGGIDPDRDVRLTVVPPPQMVSALGHGGIAGYCVGEPWNTRAAETGLGRMVATSYDLWNNSPEKVLGITREWAGRHPRTHQALLRALLEAARWLDDPDHRREAAGILSDGAYVGAPRTAIERGLSGRMQMAGGERLLRDFFVFHRYAANFPWRSHASWFLAQMIRWGDLPRAQDVAATAAAVYKPGLYRRVAAELGVPYPTVDRKGEGFHCAPWTLRAASQPIPMGPDCFLDGARFYPVLARSGTCQSDSREEAAGADTRLSEPRRAP
ncbi:CmpA/NrtA family ABC transporter substrate-binding protein [Thiohalorhabdus sp. Cl-TMA]|uniref:CmpA/NrtA family ABC transporter substrate-binding protein n=1 Tax=Thiohalorhabdus methylotrophus TaxID=3242694 RepID=A0ABV4TX69_9GAMM